MADLLGATNPVPGYDGASQNRSHSALPQVQDPRVQNVPDLSRVSRADGRTEQQGAGNHLDAGRLRYDSNLQTFLQQLAGRAGSGRSAGKDRGLDAWTGIGTRTV